MSKYEGTQTEKNLEAAFAGESQAINILILLQRLRRKVLSRLHHYF